MTDAEQQRVRRSPSSGPEWLEPRYVIWGSAGHAKVLASLVALRGGRVIALFDKHRRASPLAGVAVHVGEAGLRTLGRFEPKRYRRCSRLVAIGGSRGRDRLAIQQRFRSRGLRVESIVHPDASVCASASLGAGTQVLAQAVVAADARVGQACIVNHRASIDHECVIGDGVHIAPGATLCGCVTVHDNVMVGAGAVVLPRLSIGEDSIDRRRCGGHARRAAECHRGRQPGPQDLKRFEANAMSQYELFKQESAHRDRCAGRRRGAGRGNARLDEQGQRAKVLLPL